MHASEGAGKKQGRSREEAGGKKQGKSREEAVRSKTLQNPQFSRVNYLHVIIIIIAALTSTLVNYFVHSVVVS